MGLLRGSVFAFAMAAAAAAYAEPRTHNDEIRERLGDANRWGGHVMVVAHRGGGLAGAKRLYPENSLASVGAAIKAGAEIVEVDIQKSRDGEYVVFHDSYLDRTSTCRGRLAERLAAELKTCRLRVEGTGAATGETVPTLRELLGFTRGKILVNIDNKLEPAELVGIVALARGMGMADQLIIKQNLWNAERIAGMRRLLAAIGPGPMFMPIVADDAVHDPGFLKEVADAFSPVAVELIHWRGAAEALTPDGGPLFSGKARAIAEGSNFRLWVDTYAVVNKQPGFLAGGRGDELGVKAGSPAEAYGFWAEHGATVIQTDEPEKVISWLAADGYRLPYGEPPATEATATVGLLPTN